MTNLAVAPKPNVANTAQIADFVEFECLRRRDLSVSVVDVERIIARQDDRRSDDSIRQRVTEAFGELGTRVKHCGHNGRRYPFSVSAQGTLLECKNPNKLLPATRDLYLFLLLATRLDMRTERVKADTDATALFEHLCANVATRYWGGPSEDIGGVVFGTGKLTLDRDDSDEIDGGVFANAVDQLCNDLREGIKFFKDPDSRVTARDGKLDIVVWRRFSDARQGQLIGFGQCKTGTSWESDLQKLNPGAFCEKWMLKTPAVTPVRLYFVADRVISNWYERSKDGGIFFDRCRIMQLTDELPRNVLSQIRRWVRAAMGLHKLSFR